VRWERLLVRLANPEKYLFDFLQKLSLTFSFFMRNELRNHAAAGAYYMLLSIVPLVLVLFFIFDTFLKSYPQFSHDLFVVLSIFNENLSPELFEKFGISRRAGSAIGVIGILNLLFSSRLILASVQRAFGVIFPAEKKRNFLLENFISLGVIPVVFISVVAIGVLNSTKIIIFKYLQIGGISTYYIEPIVNTVTYALPALVAFVLVYVIFRYLPVRKPSSRSAFKGAVLFLIVFVVMRTLIYSIFKHLAANTAYGILGSLIILLIWSYFVFLLFFFCAQYVFVTYRADILILDRLFSDEKLPHRFVQLNKRILEKYTRLYREGEVLFNLGDESRNVYYLMSGELKAVVNDSLIGSIAPGEVFGEMAYITDEPRSATVRAAEDSEIVILPAAVFEEIMKENHDLSRRVTKTLCERLKKAQLTDKAL